MIRERPSTAIVVAWVIWGPCTFLVSALSCQEGEWDDGSADCVQCDFGCPLGTYREGCGGTEEGECRPCSNPIPVFSRYVAGGGLQNLCPFECDFGHYLTGSDGSTDNPLKCEPCAIDCPTGQYRKGCFEKSAGDCVDCSPAGNGARFTGGGGLSDACPVTCMAGFYSDLANEHCFECNVTCPEGKYRSQCMGTSEGFCAPCQNGPKDAVYVTYGDKHGVCEYCEDDWYAAGPLGDRTCQPCSGECDVGHFRKDCGGADHGTCGTCTKKPPNSHYTTNGNLRDNCSFACDKDFFKVDGESDSPFGICQACAPDCPAGQYRFHCGGSNAGHCEPCTVKPFKSHFIGDGGLRDVCAWECDPTFSIHHEPGTPPEQDTCGACPTNCAIGQYRSGCGLSDPGACISCTNGPPNSHYTSAGGLTNTCFWECDDTFHEHGGHPETPNKDGVMCLKCGQRCPVGEFRTGCHHEVEGTCTPCTIPNQEAIFTGDGDLLDTCPWVCEADFYTVDGECKPCPSDCPSGQWRTGCKDVASPHPKPIKDDKYKITNSGGQALKGDCVDCTNGPAFSHYTGSGGLRNVCSWSCDEATHQDGEICKPCNASCGIGYYRVGCGLLDAGTCVECTTRPWLSHYTTDGGLEDNCGFQCRASWPIQGPCVFAFLVNRVSVILLVICCLGGGIPFVKNCMKKGASRSQQQAAKLAMLTRIEEADYRSLPRQDYGAPAVLHIPGSIAYRPVDTQYTEMQPQLTPRKEEPSSSSSPGNEESPPRGRSIIGVFGHVKSSRSTSPSSAATSATVGTAPSTEVQAMKKLAWAKPQRGLRSDGMGTV